MTFLELVKDDDARGGFGFLSLVVGKRLFWMGRVGVLAG